MTRGVFVFSGVLAAAALAGGCTSGTPAHPAAAGSPSPSASTTSASPGPDAANTRDVCGAINGVIAQGVLAFGTDLGTMVGHRQGANPSAAASARTEAVRRLGDLATGVRTAARPARDPALRAAAEQTATAFARYAADPSLLSGVTTGADVTPLLAKVTQAADPLTKVCT